MISHAVAGRKLDGFGTAPSAQQLQQGAQIFGAVVDSLCHGCADDHPVVADRQRPGREKGGLAKVSGGLLQTAGLDGTEPAKTKTPHGQPFTGYETFLWILHAERE